MGDRVYTLLDIVDRKAEQVAQVLQESPSVVMADAVEGLPHVVMVNEAVERQQLAKLTIQALALVRSMTQNTHLLLEARDRLSTITFLKLPSQSRGKNRSSGKTGGSKRLCRRSMVN